MQEDKVRLREEVIERHIVRQCAPLRAFRPAVGEHTDIHCTQDAGDCHADAAKADDARRLAADLDERTLPVAKINALRPIPCVYRAVMMPDVGTRLEEQRDRILRDIVCTIDRHVHDGDGFLTRIDRVHDIVTRREYGDGFEVRTGIDHGARDRCLVRHGDLRIADALRDQRRLCEGCAVIDRQLPQCLERRPADIPRILGIAVEYNNLHRISSCTYFFSILHESAARRKPRIFAALCQMLWRNIIEKFQAVFVRRLCRASLLSI